LKEPDGPPSLFGFGPRRDGMKGGEIVDLGVLPPAKFEQFSAACNRLFRVDKWRHLIRIVEANAAELRDSIHGLRPVGVAGPDPFRAMTEVLYVGVNRRLLNLLSSIRTYLDHTDRRLSRTYGKKSAERSSFEEATAQAYDRSFAYRFLYTLRNVAQHTMIPMGAMEQGGSLQQNGGVAERSGVSIDVVSLLEESRKKWKAPLREELANGPDQLEVIPLVDEFLAELRRINEAVNRSEHRKLLADGRQILAFTALAAQKGLAPRIGWVQTHGEDTTLVFADMPLGLLSELGLVSLENLRSQAF